LPLIKKPKKLMRKNLLFALVALSVTSGLWAQGVTTATLSGRVSGVKGNTTAERITSNEEALPGATIQAVHLPTGSQYGTAADQNGRYNIQNLRVGGPYSITATFVGYESQTFSDVYIKLGEPFVLNVTLREEGTELSAVVVLGVQDRTLNSDRTGAITSIGSRELQTLPTISRSINDFTRFTPQATSTSNGAIGGGNYRQNYITVDGSDFNNTFGIGTNLPAGGSPISLDALEQISVNVTPYDIRQSNFIGSAINAITRSGTNEFSGSVYTFFRNEDQQGDQVRNNPKLIKQKFTENTYGFRLGGPIIKDKLFFFVNGEFTNSVRPGQQNFAATASAPFGSSPNISRPTADQLTQYSDFLRQTYGYETGAFDNYDFESNNTRLTGRLDWNINKNHRVSLRYSDVKSKTPLFMSGSTGGTGFNYGAGAGRTNNNALWFKNSNYFQEANFTSIALEVNSLFGKLSNTFRASYTNQNDPRSSDSRVFPFVDILDGTGVNASPITSFGYEPFSFGNLRDVKSFSFVDFVTITKGIHTLTGGVQIDLQETKNGFQRFGTGLYVFNSWNDFTTGAKPRDYAVTYSLLPNFEQAFPKVGFAQYSAYIQDEIDLTSRLKLTAGLRFDLPTFPSVPEIKTHPLVAALTFEEGKTIDTGVLPETRVMFSPRIGFNWDVKGDRSIQVRGGSGLFTGRIPTVWIVAQSGDAGLLQFTQNFNGQANTPGPFQVDPYRPATPPPAGTAIPASVSAIDPNFKFPQTWKSSLAIDAKLPFGFVGTLEGIYNRDLSIAYGQNPNLVAPENLNVAGYTDNRPIYPNGVARNINRLTPAGLVSPTGTGNFNPVVLSNGEDGYYWSVTAKLDKQFNNGLSGFVAYTKSGSKVLFDGVGDQLLNTWSITPIVGRANSPELSYAGYVVPDRVIAGITYRKEYFKHFATSISLFLESSIQGTFSYTYGGDLNRDGQNNDLIFVPNDPSGITFTDFNYGTASNPKIYTAAQQSEIFFRYIEQDEYLSSRRGLYAERNGAQLPWRSQLDLRFAQDIFTNVGGKKNTIQFTVDIFNFGNLLNKNWGVFDAVNAPGILVPTNQAALVPGGTVTPTFRLQTDRGQPVTSTFRDVNSIASTYFMQFGLRYIFN